MIKNFKSFIQSERTFYAGLVCLVGIVAFLLGYSFDVATVSDQKAPLNQAGIVFTDVTNPSVSPSAITVIASSGGTKYHLPSCSGAGRIKDENKIYFNSIEEAKAAGYEPAANCDFTTAVAID